MGQIMNIPIPSVCLLTMSLIFVLPIASAQMTAAQVNNLQARFAQSKLTPFALNGQKLYRISRGGEKALVARLRSSRPAEVAVEGEVLVSLKLGETRQSLQRALLKHKPRYRLVEQISERGVFRLLIEGRFALNPWVASADVAKLDLIEVAEPNYMMRPAQVQQGGKLHVDQWSFDYGGTAPDYADIGGDIDASEALSKLRFWRYGALEPVTVAVIDTGTDVMHPGLRNRLWTNPNEIPGNGKDDDGDGKKDDVHGWNFDQANADLSDGHGHGTHIA